MSSAFRDVDRERYRRTLAFVAVLPLAVAVAGCSSSRAHQGGRRGTHQPGLTSSTEFFTAAEGVCSDLNRKDRIPPPFTANPTFVERVAGPFVARERLALAELRLLTAPPQRQQDWSILLSYRAKLASELERLGRTAKSGDTPAFRTLKAARSSTLAAMSALAKHVGLHECAQVGNLIG
jgi:hypothetical protein